ncbi:MAG: chromosome segregation protein SMC [Deltaproteobacteria bacterium]|nr:chromosome segregation protein SMC [Deltaproteobacteria bacterium]
MKIKKVSMVGFKSFPEKLDIPFPLGLSAIVGPNGCGKSNIVDAIRWAMGEQSAKLLRGRQMEDVIFNGTVEHKPLGMAEVSLLFENGNSSFPPQFVHESEISITRRLYRSGESEYLVNNVPCRLKDIQEIFMDTGLGNRAYSIIGQGQIGSIVEQKPEETRAMLEEAAGITKYKRKKEESERKIDGAGQNLQRVEDILGEVEKQMRSLKRQAAKAKRFKGLGEEIQGLELILNAHAYQELKEESGTRMKSTEAFLQEEAVRSAEVSRIQAGVETLNLQMEEKDQEIAELRDSFLHTKEKVSRKESALEALAAEKRMQVEMEKRLEKDRQDLDRRLEELKKEKALLLEKIGQVKQAATRLEEEIALTEARAKSRQELLKQIKAAYEEARNRVQAGVSKEMSLSQESGYLNKRIGEITDSRSRLEKELSEIRQKLENLALAGKRKSEVREALTKKLLEISADVAREQQICQELDQMRKNLETQLRSLEGALHLDKTKLAGLRSLAENFEGFKIGVRTVMKAEDLRVRREGRIKGLVADIIQVEPNLEHALEAALGEKLQYVIVESQKDGKEAIEYLRARAKGRSSFIPLSELDGKVENGGGIGLPLLKDMVKVGEEYKPIVEMLLGATALAEDLDEAVSVWSSNGKRSCLVTREGDMIDCSGIISGGKAPQSTHGIFARKREMGDLEQAVSVQEKEVKLLQGKLEKIIMDKEELEGKLLGLVEEKGDCQDKINELDKANFQLGHEMDQLDRFIQRISEDLGRRDKEESKHREDLIRISSELIRSKEKREQEEVYFREKANELQGSEEEFERFRNELARLKMDHSLAREEQRGLNREVERIENFAEEARGTFRRIEEDIAGAREKHKGCTKKEEDLRDEMKGVYAQLQGAEDVLNRADQNRNILRNEIREEDKKAEIARNALEAVKEKIHRAKMEHSEITFKMESLAEMVREKYNLNLHHIYSAHLKEDLALADARERLDHVKRLRERLGEVNLTAIREHEALRERYTFITTQRQDLLDSIHSLQEAIRKINKTSLEKFTETFQQVDEKLKVVFPILFNGGTAGLKLVDESKPLESGVLVEVQPPGKKVSHMGLLSGGEKALVAMALIFAIYLIKPSPFLLLDEVDAPLDEANIDRFNDLLREIRKYSQIILVTHNRRSMEIVDRLFGVTMEKQGVSKMVTVSLEGFQVH